MLLSIAQEYFGRSVLVTGGLGFLGSVVLEQLLRLSEVEKVYLVVRSKRNTPAANRVEQLLRSPLFNSLHTDALSGVCNVFSKVQAVEGDLLLPGLGLSAADAEMLREQVHIVLHCAASIELEADIQETLSINYMGTQQLLQLASQMPRLHSFVHVSTYFVNNHRPRNSLVEEKIYPLALSLDGGQTLVKHDTFVTALLAMEPAEAKRTAAAVMQRNSFNSSYAFGKHLTEQLVAEACIGPGVHKAIVRPSLISSIAGSPYPGYITGYAGAGGYVMAYALDFFQGPRSVAYGSDAILDLIPCDTVAAVVIAAGAAAAAATAPSSTSRIAQAEAQQPADAAAAAAAAAEAGKTTTIYHAASSESHPFPIAEGFGYMHDYWEANRPPLRLPFTRYVEMNGQHRPTARSLVRGNRAAGWRLRLLAALLRLSGRAKHARQLRMAFKAHCVSNSLAYGSSMVCSVQNVRSLKAAMPPDEQQQWPVVWEPSVMHWRDYSFMFLSAVRQLLFRMTNPDSRELASAFVALKAAVTPEVLSWLTTQQLQGAPALQRTADDVCGRGCVSGPCWISGGSDASSCGDQLVVDARDSSYQPLVTNQAAACTQAAWSADPPSLAGPQTVAGQSCWKDKCAKRCVRHVRLGVVLLATSRVLLCGVRAKTH